METTGPILYIEDDEDDQHFMKTALRDLHIPNELCLFDTGQAALDFLRTTPQKPFLIVCDMNMPLMNGIELRRCLNEDESLRRKSIHFVFLTTASDPELVRIAFEETIQGFFKKADNYVALKTQIGLIISYWQAGLHPPVGK